MLENEGQGIARLRQETVPRLPSSMMRAYARSFITILFISFFCGKPLGQPLPLRVAKSYKCNASEEGFTGTLWHIITFIRNKGES